MLTNIIIVFAICLISSLIVIPKVLIPFLRKIHFGQTVREEGPESHKAKTGTPTMGGLSFVIIPCIVVLIMNPDAYAHRMFLIVFLAFVGYGLIGFIDDFIIAVQHNNEGLNPKAKMLLQALLAIALYGMYSYLGDHTVMVPFINYPLDLKWFFAIMVFIMFTGETNAVNFADGLDGLCAGLMTLALIPFIIFTIKVDQPNIALLVAGIIGSLLGYLYYNKFPAKIMMGDTGSLALGGLISALALVTHQEISLLIIGGVFVAEVVSVIMQVSYFKITHGKRIFKMAPLHHHFELSGYKETQVVKMFWAVGAVLSLIGIIIGVML